MSDTERRASSLTLLAGVSGMADFVEVIDTITTFVRNERTASYNEGVDMMLRNVRDWMNVRGITPKGDNLPDLLDEIAVGLSRPVLQGQRT